MAAAVHSRACRRFCSADHRIMDTGGVFAEDQRQNGGRREYVVYVEGAPPAYEVLFTAHGGRYSAETGFKREYRGQPCEYPCSAGFADGDDDILPCCHGEVFAASYGNRHSVDSRTDVRFADNF